MLICIGVGDVEVESILVDFSIALRVVSVEIDIVIEFFKLLVGICFFDTCVFLGVLL